MRFQDLKEETDRPLSWCPYQFPRVRFWKRVLGRIYSRDVFRTARNTKIASFCLSTGRPNPAIFVSEPRGKYRDMYNISWNVNSYTPIEEFKLSFRKLPISSPQALPGHQQPLSPQQQLQPQPNNRRQSRRVSSVYLASTFHLLQLHLMRHIL
jgi:hypothetical protein